MQQYGSSLILLKNCLNYPLPFNLPYEFQNQVSSSMKNSTSSFGFGEVSVTRLNFIPRKFICTTCQAVCYLKRFGVESHKLLLISPFITLVFSFLICRRCWTMIIQQHTLDNTTQKVIPRGAPSALSGCSLELQIRIRISEGEALESV